MGEIYATLKQIGLRDYPVPNFKTTMVTAEEFRRHFQSVQEKRAESKLSESIRARKFVRQFAKPTKEAIKDLSKLNKKPIEKEIFEQSQKVKAKRAGRVRMIFIWNANEEGQRLILTLIQVMFEEPADKWDDLIKTGIIVPLHKKRDQANSGNFRGVFLWSTASQILAKVLTTRLRN